MERGVLSVDMQGASLHRTGRRVQLRGRKGEILKEIPLFKLNSIWLFGNVEVTNMMVRLCMRDGPPIHFLTMKGAWRGSIGSEPGHRVTTRLKQYAMFVDTSRRLELAKRILLDKLESQHEKLRNWNRRRKGTLIDCLERFTTALERLDSGNDNSELLGAEGHASAAYFEAYKRLFTHDHGFYSRNRRPPKDPVNAMLSFGYTLLFSEALAAVCLSGLDPYLGFLHFPKNRRPSLALDLMEPFRRIVDELVLTRMNLMSFQNRDFVALPNGAVNLTKESLPKFIMLFGEKMAEPYISNLPGCSSVRKVIRRAAENLKEIICGRRNICESLIVSYNVRAVPNAAEKADSSV